MVCVDKCNDGARAVCRLLQAFVACLFLFIGIVCQFYAGLNVNDVPLSNLCEAYSGSREAMDKATFVDMFEWVQKSSCETNPQCCLSGVNTCVDYYTASRWFLSASTTESDSDRIDLLRYAGPLFWCKHVPENIAADPRTCGDKRRENPGADPQPCKVWPEQEAAPGEVSNWYLPAGSARQYVFHINCNDKLQVYTDFLEVMYPNWGEREIDAAAAEFYGSCIVDKGSDGYILIIGPIFALLGGVICTLTMLTYFHNPPWPEIGTNLLLIAAILLLVGFWSISITASREIFNSYTYCGKDTQAPLVVQGRWYDQTPCVDRNALGEHAYNPYVTKIATIDSTYIAGGVLTVLASLMYLGLVSGFTEKMMGQRFSKFLIKTRDYFRPPPLPFPPQGQ